jgi:hypothetical protein
MKNLLRQGPLRLLRYLCQPIAGSSQISTEPRAFTAALYDF